MGARCDGDHNFRRFPSLQMFERLLQAPRDLLSLARDVPFSGRGGGAKRLEGLHPRLHRPGPHARDQPQASETAEYPPLSPDVLVPLVRRRPFAFAGRRHRETVAAALQGLEQLAINAACPPLLWSHVPRLSLKCSGLDRNITGDCSSLITNPSDFEPRNDQPRRNRWAAAAGFR